MILGLFVNGTGQTAYSVKVQEEAEKEEEFNPVKDSKSECLPVYWPMERGGAVYKGYVMNRTYRHGKGSMGTIHEEVL
jgi:hypothetical protein